MEKIQKIINPIDSETSNGKTTLLSKFAMCGSKKSRFIKEQKSSGILSTLGLKTLLSKLPLLGDTLFWNYKNAWNSKQVLLAGDKFMPKMHLKQPGFTYSACGPITRNKERIEKFKETGDTNIFTEMN